MSSHQWKNLLVYLPFWLLGSATLMVGEIIEFGYSRDAVLPTVGFALLTLVFLGGWVLAYGEDISHKDTAVIFGLQTLGAGLVLALVVISLCGESAGPH